MDLLFFLDLLLVCVLTFSRHSRSGVSLSVVDLDARALLLRLKSGHPACLLIILRLRLILLSYLLVLLATRIKSELPLRDEVARFAGHRLRYQSSLVLRISAIEIPSLKSIASVHDLWLIQAEC